MRITLDESLDQNYRWVMSHYDSVVSGVNGPVYKAYFNVFISTAVGVIVWLILREFVENSFLRSDEFLVILALTASGVFLFYGKVWSVDIKQHHLDRRFSPKAVAYIPKVKGHLKSDYARNLCKKIEDRQQILMADILEFLIREKTLLGIPSQKRINHVPPSEGFFDN